MSAMTLGLEPSPSPTCCRGCFLTAGQLPEQVLQVVDRVEDYLGGWHPALGRRREMELSDAVVATVFYHRRSTTGTIATRKLPMWYLESASLALPQNRGEADGVAHPADHPAKRSPDGQRVRAEHRTG